MVAKVANNSHLSKELAGKNIVWVLEMGNSHILFAKYLVVNI